MPNWCMTSYKIVGKRTDVERIKDAVENHPIAEKSDSTWQGNILTALGITGFENRSIRGFVSNHDYIQTDKDTGQLSINCEEAWTRTDFAELLEAKFPDLSIYWQAEEPGCEVYQTNDNAGEYFPERYFVDTCIGGNYESEYFTNMDDAYEWIAQRTDCENADDVKKWNENRQMEDSDDFIYVHEFDIV